MNFLDVNDFTPEIISSVFDIADKIESGLELQTLKGKTCIAFFPESSIRTRITFELAVKKLGGEFILFPNQTLDKGEDYRDVIGYIQNWADLCIIRHGNFNMLKTISESASIPIVNAMTSSNHPCEILSDLFSLSRLKGDYTKLVFTFVGAPGNILFSWLNAAKHLGFKINHVSVPENKIQDNNEFYSFYEDIDTIIGLSDIVLTDGIPNVLRNEGYYFKYQITGDIMKKAKEGAKLNPCPPFHRGEEVSAEIIESNTFVGYDFKKSLLSVQASIIHHCMTL